MPTTYPQGQLLSAPLTNGTATAQFGTHIDFLGVGGLRTVSTLADRDAIVTKNKLEYDGYGSGQRRVLMLVAVSAEERLYVLNIPGFASMSDAQRLGALQSNDYWQLLTDYITNQGGEVFKAATFAALPAPGTAGVLYVTLDTNLFYRWDGASYVQIGVAPDVDRAYVDAQDAAVQNFVIVERDALYVHVDDADAALQAQIDNRYDKAGVDYKNSVLQAEIGTLNNLTTSDKSNLVAAINEVKTIAGAATVTGAAVEAVIDDTGETYGEMFNGKVRVRINNYVINSTHLAAGAVSGGVIADKGIGAGKYATVSIYGNDIADYQIGANKLIDGAATTAKIADGAVTTAKLGADATTLINGKLSAANNLSDVQVKSTAIFNLLGNNFYTSYSQSTFGQPFVLEGHANLLTTAQKNILNGSAYLRYNAYVGINLYDGGIESYFAGAQAGSNPLNENNGSHSNVVALSRSTGNSAALVNNAMVLFNNSYMKLPGAGSRVVVVSPDGTKLGKLGVDNTGGLLWNGAAVGSSASTGTGNTSVPPVGFTGAVAPYYVRTEYATGWWVCISGSSNRVVSTYNGGNNMVFPNGSGSSYSEYVGSTQTWHLKPLWCQRIRGFYQKTVNNHNLIIRVKKSSDLSVVLTKNVIFNAPSVYAAAGGVDKWTADFDLFLPGYDSYIMEVETVPTTTSTDGSATSFWFHGDYIID